MENQLSQFPTISDAIKMKEFELEKLQKKNAVSFVFVFVFLLSFSHLMIIATPIFFISEELRLHKIIHSYYSMCIKIAYAKHFHFHNISKRNFDRKHVEVLFSITHKPRSFLMELRRRWVHDPFISTLFKIVLIGHSHSCGGKFTPHMRSIGRRSSILFSYRMGSFDPLTQLKMKWKTTIIFHLKICENFAIFTIQIRSNLSMEITSISYFIFKQLIRE